MIRPSLSAMALIAFIVAARGAETKTELPKQAPLTKTTAARKTNCVMVVVNLAIADKGLNVICPTEMSASAKNRGELRIGVVNLLPEEVFLTVESLELDHLGYDLSRSDDDFASGAGVGDVFPDNLGLLKRLHSCAYGKDGKPHPCGCACADFDAKIDFGRTNLREFIGAKCKVTLPIKGYFRSNGKEFSKSVAFSLTITK